MLDPYITYDLSDLDLVNACTTWLGPDRHARHRHARRPAHLRVPRLRGDGPGLLLQPCRTADGRVGCPGARRPQERRQCSVRSCTVRMPPGERGLAGAVGRRLALRGERSDRARDRRLRALHPRTRGRPGPRRRPGLGAAGRSRSPARQCGRGSDDDGGRSSADTSPRSSARSLCRSTSRHTRRTSPPCERRSRPACSTPTASPPGTRATRSP